MGSAVMRGRRWSACAAAAIAVLAMVVLPGCAVGYLAQSVAGHVDVISKARPVDAWLADPSTSQPLRQRLELAKRLRTFAVQELRLPDHASFRQYAPLGRPAVVWNVVAAPELSLELKTWCFHVVGCVTYRGYFDRQAALDYAQSLRLQGWEVHVADVPAYSTLGKTDWLGGDPLLDTFLFWDEASLARLMFHEMAHPVVFVPGDTAFNESFATAVERLGVRRWWQFNGREGSPPSDSRRVQQQRALRDLRDLLREVYGRPIGEDDRRQAKARVLAEFRSRHPDIAPSQLNNAALALQSSYDDGVSAFLSLFDASGRDFEKFYEAARRWAQLSDERRREMLRRSAEPLTPTVSGEPLP